MLDFRAIIPDHMVEVIRWKVTGGNGVATEQDMSEFVLKAIIEKIEKVRQEEYLPAQVREIAPYWPKLTTAQKEKIRAILTEKG